MKKLISKMEDELEQNEIKIKEKPARQSRLYDFTRKEVVKQKPRKDYKRHNSILKIGQRLSKIKFGKNTSKMK